MIWTKFLSLYPNSSLDHHFANGSWFGRQKGQNAFGKVANFARNKQRREARSCQNHRIRSRQRSLELLSSSMNRIINTCLSRNFSTCQVSQRWHKDKVENRHHYRFGYKDKVKRTGPLPRLGDDAKRIETRPIFEPSPMFSPANALRGQNDYIDILGENPDALKPHEIQYQMPKYLRGLSGYKNDYQQALKLKQYLADTAVPEVKPKEWEFLNRRIERRYRELRRFTDQNMWKNYKGIKGGPANDPFKTKTF